MGFGVWVTVGIILSIMLWRPAVSGIGRSCEKPGGLKNPGTDKIIMKQYIHKISKAKGNIRKKKEKRKKDQKEKRERWKIRQSEAEVEAEDGNHPLSAGITAQTGQVIC